MNQKRLEAKKGVYRYWFGSVRKFEVDEICLVLEPYYKDNETSFLSVVGNSDELFVRLLKPREYLVEELDLQQDKEDLGEIKKERKFSQTFTASRDNLMGVGVMINSYGRKRDISSYQLALYDEDCFGLVRMVNVDKRLMSAGYFVDVFFDPVGDSRSKKYCFSFISENDEPLYPVSFYVAKTFRDPYRGKYDGGELIVDGKKTTMDIIFRLLYKD